MLTKAQALTLTHGQTLHYTGRHDCTRHVGPRGGVRETITQVRVNGRCQTWKTRPEDFRVPVKYGMYESAEITHWNAGEWHMVDECPLASRE
jgi:hypothetical protein